MADADVIWCWDAGIGPWCFVPVDLDPHSSEYSAMREHLRTRGNPVFASLEEVSDYARKAGWPMPVH
jgi:hypothetical protein